MVVQLDPGELKLNSEVLVSASIFSFLHIGNSSPPSEGGYQGLWIMVRPIEQAQFGTLPFLVSLVA